jgi:hypothetical protein
MNAPELEPSRGDASIRYRMTIGRDGARNIVTWSGAANCRERTSHGPRRCSRTPAVRMHFSRPPGHVCRSPSQTGEPYIPSSYDGQTPAPWFLLHGYSQPGETGRNYMQFRPLAEARGFTLPDSPVDTAGFHSGTVRCCCDFYADR